MAEAETVSQFNTQAKLLARLIADVKARLGSFLANEKYLYDLEPRIKALIESGKSDIAATGKVLFGKEQALLKLQKDIEAEAMAFIGRAGDLKTKIDTNPLYAFLKTPWRTWGYRQFQIVGDLVKEAASLTPGAAGLTDRLVTQNKNVTILQKEVATLEKAATGQGFIPRIENLFTSSVQTAGAAALSVVAVPLLIGAATILGAIMLLRKKRK